MRSRTNVECVKTKMAFLLLLLPSCKTLYAVAFVRVMSCRRAIRSRPTVRGRMEQRAEHMCVHGRCLLPFSSSSTTSGLQNEWGRRRRSRITVSLPRRRRILVSSHHGCTGAGCLPAHLGLAAVDTPFMHNENVRCRAVILYTRKQTIIVGYPCPIYRRIICRVGEPITKPPCSMLKGAQREISR